MKKILALLLVLAGCPAPKDRLTEIPGVVGPEVVDPFSGQVEQLVYIRDDLHVNCFAYFRGYPNSLTRVNCEGI